MTVGAVSRRTTTTLAVVMVCVALTAAALAFAAPSAKATGPHNQFLAVQVGSNGQFNIGAYPAADGSATTGVSWDLSYSWAGPPWSSFTTVRVDGSDYRYGTGTPVQAPTDTSATTNTSQWRTTTGDILVTQQLSLVANSATGRQDVAQIAYTVKNTGAASHAVGLRLMIDTEINYNDRALFRVPGVGALSTEREFNGAAVPHGTYVFDTVADSTHVAFVASRFAGPAPDRMVFAYWGALRSTSWDYTVDTTSTIGDSAYALYWNPGTLAPGQSRTYVSSYGLGASSVNLTPPLALGVFGPNRLNVVAGAYSPNPFDVNAWVSDVGTGPATNVTATINLPAGLQLASGTKTLSLGGLAVSEEKQASWSVLALPQTSARTVTYSVTVVADGLQPKTVKRTLALPATTAITPKVTLKLSGLTRGAMMLGKRVTAKGKVTPTSLAGSKVKLTVQKKKSGRWVTVKRVSRLISATATYSWRYRPLSRGAYRMRAAIPNTTAKSVWRAFRVK